MDKFKKTFSIRKKSKHETNESRKPQLWVEDEKKIKEGSCSFQVKVVSGINLITTLSLVPWFH